MVTGSTYLTRDGYEQLKEELEHLVSVRRGEVSQKLREAMETGDFLEDGTLEIVRSEQSVVEGRIEELKSILSGAVVIDETAAPRDRVGLGGRITVVEAGGDGTHETYRLVGPVEADPSRGMISNESPLGKALMDHQVGDTVVVSTPSGEVVFQILEIA